MVVLGDSPLADSMGATIIADVHTSLKLSVIVGCLPRRGTCPSIPSAVVAARSDADPNAVKFYTITYTSLQHRRQRASSLASNKFEN